MRVALCARVSTADKGQDPRVQTLELQEYCQRRGLSVAGEYVDVGIRREGEAARTRSADGRPTPQTL